MVRTPAQTSVSPDKIVKWLTRYLPQGMTDVLVTRVTGDAHEPILQSRVDASWNAPDGTEEIFDACKESADIHGGKQVYRVSVCNGKGIEMAGVSLTVITDIEPIMQPGGKESDNAFRLADAMFSRFDRLFGVAERMLLNAAASHENAQKQILALHDKTMQQFEEVEKARSLQHDREVAAFESKARLEMQERGFTAIGEIVAQWGPIIAAKKLGIDPKVLMAMIPQKPADPSKPAAPAAPGGSRLGSLLSQIDDMTLFELIASLPEDKQAKLKDALSPEAKAAVDAMIDSLPDLR